MKLFNTEDAVRMLSANHEVGIVEKMHLHYPHSIGLIIPRENKDEANALVFAFNMTIERIGNYLIHHRSDTYEDLMEQDQNERWTWFPFFSRLGDDMIIVAFKSETDLVMFRLSV